MPAPLDAAALDALAETLRQMTPGPWMLDHDDTFVYASLCGSDIRTPGWLVELPHDFRDFEPPAALDQWKANMRGLVALVNAYPALVEELRRLRAQVEEAERSV